MPLTDWCRTISLKHAHGFERGVARQNGAWLRGYRTYGSHMAYESFMKTYPLCLLAIALLGFSSLATTRVPASPTLADYVTEANAAYYDLPRSLSAYNSAIRGICQAIQTGATQEFAASLDKLGVSFNPPQYQASLAVGPDCRILSRIKRDRSRHPGGARIRNEDRDSLPAGRALRGCHRNLSVRSA